MHEAGPFARQGRHRVSGGQIAVHGVGFLAENFVRCGTSEGSELVSE